MRHEIFVTNRNDFHHSDSFDGVEYDFPPAERVIVPVDAAVHMFGFNQPDKSSVLARLGWAWRPSPDGKKFIEDDDGVKRLARFVFTKAVMIEAPVDAPEPAPVGLADMPEPAMVAAVSKRKTPPIDFLASATPLV